LKERNGTIEYLMLAGFILDGGVCGTYNLKWKEISVPMEKTQIKINSMVLHPMHKSMNKMPENWKVHSGVQRILHD
jgi:hypothetical protein